MIDYDDKIEMLEERIDELERSESINSWVFLAMGFAIFALALKVVLL